MNRSDSWLERLRAAYVPRLPRLLADPSRLAFTDGEATSAVRDAEAIATAFPRTFGRPVLNAAGGAARSAVSPLAVGVVLSGGQAPGGHNVIAGLFDALKAFEPGSTLFGFRDGPRGILEGDSIELTAEGLVSYRNSGGFDLIGSGRDKIETPGQLEAAAETCERLGLHGLVVVGGDDSNTNAAVLAESFAEHGRETVVVGVPKTIDGDLKSASIETSFGFDTATKVYGELIGNICRDASSARKYWHVIKLMGRSASHVTLECALATRPNVALIGEEVERRGMTLDDLAAQIAGVVRRRADAGRHYGVVLVPEGIVEFVPEMRALIQELNVNPDVERLGRDSRHLFDSLPQRIGEQLLLDRDSHGNVQVSKIDTEQLLIELVRRHLDDATPFSVQGHFFGYEGRCAAPSDFDADYTNALGRLAAALVAHRRSGYMCGIGNLAAAPEEWTAFGLPLTSMMQVETRKGRAVPVIGKALVELDAAPFTALSRRRESWVVDDAYRSPGAIQYFGPAALTQMPSRTLLLERTGSDEPPAWLEADA